MSTVTKIRMTADDLLQLADDTLDGGDLLPNFRAKVAQLLPPAVT